MAKRKKVASRVPTPLALERHILSIRSHNVMLDSNLAALYEVEVRALNQAVSRNRSRFPEDFMFRLSKEEWRTLRSRSVTLDSGRGQHSKYAPRAFSEHGVLMLSSVLRSERAVQANIAIMRAFVRMREMLASHQALARHLEALELRYDRQFKVIFDAIRGLMAPAELPRKLRIGFEEDVNDRE